MPYPIKRKYQEYRGAKYFEEGNYNRSVRGGPGKGKLMHRAVWEDARGPIPQGYHLHHKDENGHNNALSNLQLVTPKKHKKIHGPSGAWTDPTEKRSAMRKAEWKRKQPIDYICVQCGDVFSSIATRPAFCSRRCRRRSYL